MDSLIEVKNLNFSYGNKKVLKDVNFNVGKGTIYGLVGSNGAGKTTLLQILLELLKPEKGNILISGYKLCDLPKGKIGYLAERPYYHLNFKLKEYLSYLAKISSYKVSESQIDNVIELVSLQKYENDFLSNFSKGMLQRVGLAQSFLHRPELLILDEPMSGLDPVGQSKLRDIIIDINNKGTTVLITSHNLYEIDRLSDEIAVLHEGKVKNISEERLNDHQKIQIEVKNNKENLEDIFSNNSKVQVDENNIVFDDNNEYLYKDVMRKLLDNNIKIYKLTTSHLSLEKITLKYLDEGSGHNV